MPVLGLTVTKQDCILTVFHMQRLKLLLPCTGRSNSWQHWNVFALFYQYVTVIRHWSRIEVWDRNGPAGVRVGESGLEKKKNGKNKKTNFRFLLSWGCVLKHKSSETSEKWLWNRTALPRGRKKWKKSSFNELHSTPIPNFLLFCKAVTIYHYVFEY